MNDAINMVSIKLDAAGRGSVAVNGVDLAEQLDGVQLVAEGATAPRVMLLAKADVDIDVEGVVQVTSPNQRTPGQVIREFLGEVNPDELEEKALMRQGSVPVAFLETLKELADKWAST